LYEPHTLKQTIKIARKVEKSLASQTKVLRLVQKNSSFQLPKMVRYKESEPTAPITNSTIAPNQSTPSQLTLHQKRSLGLCFKCGAKYFQGHKCKVQGLHVLDGDEISDVDSENEESE
jgi:hypothetical protein